MPHPGVGPISVTDTPVYHWYYVWVIPVLVLSVLLFQVPWWAWKKYWEGRRITAFMEVLSYLLVEDPEDIIDKKEKLMDYFCAQINSPVHDRMAIRYVCCEIANFLHVLGQVMLTEYLLDWEFSTYGIDVVRFLTSNQDTRFDPLTRVFPRVTTCHLNLYGPSGTVELKEGLCIMPMNSIFEKCFVFLW